ncbi:MAG: type II secretion system inner membrane protein GspF [Oceanicoccus sp.]|uniref:type II secretion system inner membrane protein GspF n=1 Tax=Oceanicoccus sp. TaxID=2691044 RepID=UPI0026052A02|nr:type II secretion system inner membrane protein GspF [Oceanicoccus sp.]MDG1773296.1 type II secretion system inner membrane protein GspF [Oceanicoccus sp.]
MASFSYAALDDNGNEQKGVIEADTPRQVRQILRDRGLAPLQVDSAQLKTASNDGANVGEAYATPSLFNRGPSIKVGELATITRQLATLIQSSMPLEEALTAISQQSESDKLKGVVLAVRSKVMEGHSLADSMADFPRAFPVLYRATVSAGEHAGHLDLVLSRLADYTENTYQSRQKTKLAMLYPLILLVMSIAIVSGLMAFVVPDVVEVFIGQGQALPVLTQALISLSDFIVSYGLLVIVLLILAVSGLRYALQNKALKIHWDRRLLGLPLTGRFSRGTNTARYTSTLSILTSSGVPLVDAMKISAEVIENSFLQQAVTEATQQVREGGSLHQSLEQNGYFPPIMIHMIASGESSGDLDAMLERVAENQQRELDDLVTTLIGIFEPAMLLLMGGAVLIIVVAILQPIFDLNQLI